MRDEISAAVRLLVVSRAARRCEYCLLHEDDSFMPHQIDHIISRKHGGNSSADNLALACIRYNAWKGSDIASWGFEPGRISLYSIPDGTGGRTTFDSKPEKSLLSLP